MPFMGYFTTTMWIVSWVVGIDSASRLMYSSADQIFPLFSKNIYSDGAQIRFILIKREEKHLDNVAYRSEVSIALQTT